MPLTIAGLESKEMLSSLPTKPTLGRLLPPG
jgi:hypothetical protein